jgi:hypothetical protein
VTQCMYGIWRRSVAAAATESTPAATRLAAMIQWRCTVCGIAVGAVTATCLLCGGRVSAESHPHPAPAAQLAAPLSAQPDSPHLPERDGAVVIPGTDKAIVAPPPSVPVHRQRRPVQARMAAPARGRVGPMGLSAGGSMGH